ncbi:hypothetical protein Cob_v008380 [Colletotrichum orbiculare MAFF 240422]|uniref:Uncharacterized protein n=1 Tax=Colletotrichum orbiculare (strain 104-T / ATCC 96160 / CBS 514.97 / LARS 414 / MAFF 240422) TaxID=1213857 RepID=A0A484FKD0_COLOR|nr:hypothetical protein Cob_v008380 [Colletotrichum orbiculare MAFF 240422]
MQAPIIGYAVMHLLIFHNIHSRKPTASRHPPFYPCHLTYMRKLETPGPRRSRLHVQYRTPHAARFHAPRTCKSIVPPSFCSRRRDSADLQGTLLYEDAASATAMPLTAY